MKKYSYKNKVCGTPDYFDSIKIQSRDKNTKTNQPNFMEMAIKRAKVFNWKSIDKLKTYEPKSAKKICYALKYGAPLSRKEKIDKLSMICQIKMAYNKPYSQKREKKHRASGPCLVCGGQANYKHHIFMLKNNGVNNAWNMIDICHNCHSEIHAWIEPNPTPEMLSMDESYRNTIR